MFGRETLTLSLFLIFILNFRDSTATDDEYNKLCEQCYEGTLPECSTNSAAFHPNMTIYCRQHMKNNCMIGIVKSADVNGTGTETDVLCLLPRQKLQSHELSESKDDGGTASPKHYPQPVPMALQMVGPMKLQETHANAVESMAENEDGGEYEDAGVGEADGADQPPEQGHEHEAVPVNENEDIEEMEEEIKPSESVSDGSVNDDTEHGTQDEPNLPENEEPKHVESNDYQGDEPPASPDEQPPMDKETPAKENPEMNAIASTTTPKTTTPTGNTPTDTVETLNCFVCSSSDDAECVKKPKSRKNCKFINENRKGCYALLHADTNVATRGCASDLTDEGMNYCQANTKLCTICYQNGCNDHEISVNNSGSIIATPIAMIILVPFVVLI